MSVDILDEMTRLWSELRSSLKALDAKSSEAEVNKLLERVVVLGGVERQSVYPGLEDLDDEGDAATSEAAPRWEKIQSAMEGLGFPLSDSAWKAFTEALSEHLDKSPKDVGARLEALPEEDRAKLGEQAKVMREALS